ncbi:DNA mismatch repair endonuclease MutL [Vibrio sp. vnigr-6D03]|uniref:DNA mismatch repair endonuclease MutL n=1 Tax=Vibrio sp. vnigr-6D03 TaxID=2058088 RepID=UPI000C34059D|nr:DNA mismatch repair endonuclease MutL [Vibrio sp. vnigr-6D03]PKF80567.1 DNA mismatch repair endonuclease MutL [Vibrio sp. vnigr-6D03]
MTIKILPARLANQIAAGEVVERPASVVKELVENSLDSGATRIDIDIDKGGAKLIRVRDNGKGIIKDELGLALSRHATSKIHTLDDLEAIMSLGFRGEALASISSVARLTMTSRPATQDQAWSAYSEGRDMEVKLQPTAHPIGTSVEVLDLFFNTPARRKFLRTEKTEFSHIDELLKRIALSRFDVTINLRHNGKMIRQYRAAKTERQEEARIAAVCGGAFVRHMLKIELEHQGLKLHGWITTPEGARQQSDLQYCYVNGRMMRDKLINHAIRQSYENSLSPDQYATYVLFIELDPHQVDVNVHPAKHEVRFHQARLVHDFIYQALSDALSQSEVITPVETRASAYHQPTTNEEQHRVMEAIASSPAYPRKAEPVSYNEALSTQRITDAIPSDITEHHQKNLSPSTSFSSTTNRSSATNNEWQQTKTPNISGSVGSRSKPQFKEEAPSWQEVKAYKELLNTPEDTKPIEHTGASTSKPQDALETKRDHFVLGKAFTIVGKQYLLMEAKPECVLVNLPRAEWHRTQCQLSASKAPLKAQPLLVPLSIKLDKNLVEQVSQFDTLLQRLGIQLREKNARSIMVMAVPQPIRQQNLQLLIPDLLSYLQNQTQEIEAKLVSNWLATEVTQVKATYSTSEAIQLISDIENLNDGRLPVDDPVFCQPIDFASTIAVLNS